MSILKQQLDEEREKIKSERIELVYAIIDKYGPISAIPIAERSGLNISAVRYIIKELQKQGRISRGYHNLRHHDAKMLFYKVIGLK